MESILCIKLASRGDLLLAGPAFRELRVSNPNSKMKLIVGKSCEEVALHLPFFDEVITVDDRRILAGTLFEKILGTWELYRCLCQSKASDSSSKAYLFHRDWRYSPWVWLTGIPLRKGFSKYLSTYFLTHSVNVPEDEHHALQYLRMMMGEEGLDLSETSVKANLAGCWCLTERERNLADAKVQQLGFLKQATPWVGLAFGGGRNVKTRTFLKSWEIENWKVLAKRLERRGVRCVWLGDAEDAADLGGVDHGLNLAGKLTIVETSRVVESCRAVVANDSFLLHMSEALGVSVLGLFGPTNFHHYRPRGAGSSYLWGGEGLECSPCHRDGYFPECAFQHQCMKKLTVTRVEERLMSILHS